MPGYAALLRPPIIGRRVCDPSVKSHGFVRDFSRTPLKPRIFSNDRQTVTARSTRNYDDAFIERDQLGKLLNVTLNLM